MDENKSYTDITEEISVEEDALKDELLSVEKKDKKIKRMGMKKSIMLVSVAILLIVALIAGYMIWGDTDEPTDENVKLLYDYNSIGISQISIQNNVHNETVVLTSFMNGTKEEWNIQGQKYDDVSQSALKNLVQYAKFLQSRFILPYSDAGLREYGLSEPQAIVEITGKDNSKVKIYVGGGYGSSEGTYVYIEGIEEIYVVHDYYRGAFTMERARMLNLPSLSKTALNAQILSIINKERVATTLAYIPDAIYGTDAWHLIEPTSSSTSATAIDTLFTNIGDFALTSYYAQAVGEDIEKYGFNEPVLELQSFDIDNKMLDHLVIGKECDEVPDTRYCVILKDGEELKNATVYLVKNDQLTLLSANPANLANPYLLSVNINWLRGGKITVDGKVYEITIDRQLRYDDTGKVLLDADGNETTNNTYYINGKKLDELQFKHFYSTFLFLQIEGVVDKDAPKGKSVLKYDFDVVIPITDSKTGVTNNRNMKYIGDYLLVSDGFAVLDSNQSENAVFTVRTTSVDQIITALGLLLEGRMPTN
jgi:hypothetical protein